MPLNASYTQNVKLVIIAAVPSVEMSACFSKKSIGSKKHPSLVIQFSKTMDSQTGGRQTAGNYASPVPYPIQSGDLCLFISAPRSPLSTCRPT